MRILHLAKYYWPRSGGMARVVQELAEGVAERGHDVEIVAVERILGPRGQGRNTTRVTRAFSFGAVGSQELAPGYLFAAWRKADIVHLHHPHSLADLAYLLTPRFAPLVVTHHGDSTRTLNRPLARLVLRRAAAIVVPSEAHVAMCSELEGLEGKLQVVPFGIDVSRWEMTPYPPPGNPPRAIFIGRLERWKGVDILLRALELVPELRLDIVGSGPDMNRLRTLSQALAVTDRVRWWGEYPDEDLPRRMADADFLVLPSVTTDEKFGLVLLEAMAAGRPVITTAVPSGVREVNVAGVTGVEVPIRNVEALAGAMRTLARDHGLRERMGRAGQARAKERFSRDGMAERHLDIYRRALEGRRGPFG